MIKLTNCLTIWGWTITLAHKKIILSYLKSSFQTFNSAQAHIKFKSMKFTKVEESHTPKLLKFSKNKKLNFMSPNIIWAFTQQRAPNLFWTSSKQTSITLLKNPQKVTQRKLFMVIRILNHYNFNKSNFSLHIHTLFQNSHKQLETFTFPIGVRYQLMSISTYLTKLLELMVNFQELTICHISIQVMDKMQLIAWEFLFPDTFMDSIITIILEISVQVTPKELQRTLSFKLTQDSQFSVNGKLIGIKDTICLLNIIYSRKKKTQPNTY